MVGTWGMLGKRVGEVTAKARNWPDASKADAGPVSTIDMTKSPAINAVMVSLVLVY
jgi:hypothetical protein